MKRITGSKIDEEAHEQIKQIAHHRGYDSKSKFIRDIVLDEIDWMTTEDRDDIVTPIDDRKAELYRCLVDEVPLEGKHYVDQYSSSIAQKTGIAKKDLQRHLRQLDKIGYVTLSLSHLGEYAEQYIRIKPPAVRPDEWAYRSRRYRDERGYQPRSQTDTHTGATTDADADADDSEVTA